MINNNKNIFLAFESFDKDLEKKWKLLLHKLNKIFSTVDIITMKNSNINTNNYIIVNPNIYKISFILKNLKNIFSFQETKIFYLSDHPFYNNGFKKLIPKWLIKIHLICMYIFIESKLKKFRHVDVFIMEPKNFLYTPLIIILELICNKNNFSFNFIHWSYLLENIRVYDSLERKDEKLIHYFNTDSKPDYSNVNFSDYSKQVSSRYERMMNKKKVDNDQNELALLKKLTNKKIAVISLSKPNNYREFYFIEKKNNFNLEAIINTLNQNGFDVILRKHPLSSTLPKIKSKFFTFTGSFYNLDKLVDINLHLSTSSHSYFDAISLNIPIAILSTKDTYSMKTIMPEVFIENSNQLQNFIKNYHEIDYNNKFRKLIYGLDKLLKNNNLKRDQSNDVNKSSEIIYNFYFEKYN